ncbi:MAG: hypothetical protein HW416_1579 [Chloroflexi bacterium]|nr:hypothetical protein [Chloroflexota bacterium]
MSWAEPVTRKGWTLLAAVLGSSIVFLDSTVVNVALPRIGQELPAMLFGVLEGQSYIYNGYLLTLSALLILAGALSDYYGRRRMFIVGLLGFGVTSAACGLAPNVEALVLMRVLQGAMGAMLIPGSLAIIRSAFEGEEQGRAFGLWSGASAGTTILGPFVGGLLVDTLSWRVAFLMNVPLVAIALWAAVRHVRESRDEEATGSFDWLGAAVVALGVGGLAFGTIYGQQREWQDRLAFVALGVGTVATVAFPFLMRRAAHPLVPLSLFRSRNFTVTNLSTLVIYGSLYVNFYYMPLFLHGTLGYSAAAGGLAGVPASLLLALFSARSGALAARYGPRWFMAVGPVLMSLGVFWLSRLPADSQPWLLRPSDPASMVPPMSYVVDVLPAMLMFGVGLMLVVAPLTTALMTSVPAHQAGLASSINNAISRVGPQIVGAIVFVAITSSFYQGLSARVPGLDQSQPDVRHQISPLNPPPEGTPPQLAAAAREASADAFHLAMKVGASLLVVGGLINGLGIRKQEPLNQPTAARVVP